MSNTTSGTKRSYAQYLSDLVEEYDNKALEADKQFAADLKSILHTDADGITTSIKEHAAQRAKKTLTTMTLRFSFGEDIIVRDESTKKILAKHSLTLPCFVMDTNATYLPEDTSFTIVNFLDTVFGKGSRIKDVSYEFGNKEPLSIIIWVIWGVEDTQETS